MAWYWLVAIPISLGLLAVVVVWVATALSAKKREPVLMQQDLQPIQRDNQPQMPTQIQLVDPVPAEELALLDHIERTHKIGVARRIKDAMQAPSPHAPLDAFTNALRAKSAESESPKV